MKACWHAAIAGFSTALYDAEIAAAASAKLEPSRSFQAILADCHTNVPALAKRLDIGRGVLADLVNGGMRAPVGKRLVNAITSALGITVQAFDSGVSNRAGDSARGPC